MTTNYKTCQALIWLDDKGHANTYCMREAGHTGKHYTFNCEPCEDAMCAFAHMGIDHEHPDPKDLTKARVQSNSTKWIGVWGTNG